MIISHIGQVTLAPGLVLDKVLYVPTFKHNLLSVQKLLKDNNCHIQFYATHCTVIDCDTQQIKAVGSVRNGLYYILVDSHVISNCLSAKTNPISMSLWHHRLGHASISAIKKIPDLQQSTSQKNNQICISCSMAKYTKLPFHISTSHASDIFDLIHMDIWGPYKVPYESKYRYFLTLVDVHSRTTWIYLLQLKSEALTHLKIFY